MGKIIHKWILAVIVAGFSLSAFAYGDDVKKPNSKKNSHLNPFNKKHTASSKDKEDTLVYDKALEDTLTFGDGKSSDDTLIFADDEKQMMRNPNNNQSDSRDFSLTNSFNSIALTSVIYPNPSFGQSTLEISAVNNSITEIILTSHDGTIIKREYTKDTRYELTNLAAGKYIIIIKNGNQTVQKRLFVK